MRISGITIPDNKRLEIGLTVLHGIGCSRAKKILGGVGISFDTRARELSVDDENKIRKSIEAFKIEGDLRREVSGDIKRLKDIQCYRGGRHTKRLPSRGQRTQTNSRTVRGNVRATMGSGKRKTEKK